MPDWLTVQLTMELVGIGLVAGLVGGMLGVGGGIVMIPAMAFLLGEGADAIFGVESFHVYKLGAIATTVVLSIPAIRRHRRAGAIVPGVVLGMVPLAVVGVVLGVLLTRVFAAEQTLTLRRLFGVFLELVAGFNLYQAWALKRGHNATARACPVGRRSWLYGIAAGLPSGLISGLLGVGGGIVAVPVQRMAFGISLRNAIANSSAAILPIAVATTVAMSWRVASAATDITVSSGFVLTACLAPGALVGAWCGAGLTHRVPVPTLRVAFQVLLAIAGARLIVAH